MRGIRDAMLTGISATAMDVFSAEGFGGFATNGGLCSIEGEGGGEGEGAGAGAGGGGSGGAADLLDEPGGGGDGGAGEGGEGGGKPAGDVNSEEHDGSFVDVPDHLKAFSADKGDQKLSNQEWLAKIGIKDLDDLAGRYRSAEKGLREGGRIKIPGEGASDDEKAAFRAAMGVPEAADKYEIALPTAPGIAEDYAIDTAFSGPLAEIAFEHNVPAPAFKALAEKFMQLQADNIANEAVALNSDMDKYFKDLGTGAEGRKAEFKRGAQLMGLDKQKIARIQAGLGVAETLNMVSAVGQAAGEDYFAGDGGRAQFGVASSSDAKGQLDALIADPVSAKAIRNGEEPYKSKYNRLVRAQAHFAEIEARNPRR